jgi:hypothetical protein
MRPPYQLDNEYLVCNNEINKKGVVKMAHIKMSETRAEATPTEWLGVGRDIGRLANKWSLRDDLVAYVGPGAGGSAPACYNPTTAEIEVNVDVAFGKEITPLEIGDISNRSTQYEFPKATGAIIHEAFHARFSSWSMPKAYEELEKDEYKALILLEESRIEYQGVISSPKARTFLRACAMEIVIGDTKDMENETETQSLSNLVGLVHARIDAGILDAHEVKDVTTLVENQLGVDVVSKLREIVSKAQLHDNHRDATELYPLAKEWAKIVRDTAKKRGDENKQEGKNMPKELLKAILDALGEASDSVELNNFDELADQEQSEDWKDEVKAKASEAEEQKENEEVAKKVFSKTSGPGQSNTNSTLTESREPTFEELRASLIIGEALEKAKYRERDEIQVSSIVPPGRLRARAIVQNTAYRARGQMAQAKPFRRTVRKHTDEPTLNVGVMVDISGSMGSAMNPMATTAWVMSEAVNRIQGNCAMVYYGNDVFPTLSVGERLDKVNVYSASDGTEKFQKAFQALDGSLNLLNGNGARLLVIVSDGQYTPEETKRAKEIVEKCKESGVAILWLPFDSGRGAKDIGGDYAEVVLEINQPAETAEVIGRSAQSVMTRIGERESA